MSRNNKHNKQSSKEFRTNAKKAEIIRTIKKLNGVTVELNHIVEIYPEEVKASEEIKNLHTQRIEFITETQKIANLETATEQEINKLSQERFALSFMNFSKKFELSKQIGRKKALLENLQQMHTEHSSLVLTISDEISKIANKHEYACDINLLLRKYYTFVTYFYNPKIEKLNSLMGTTFPTKDPHKLSTTPLFAITEESQAQKLLSIQDEIEM